MHLSLILASAVVNCQELASAVVNCQEMVLPVAFRPRFQAASSDYRSTFSWFSQLFPTKVGGDYKNTKSMLQYKIYIIMVFCGN